MFFTWIVDAYLYTLPCVLESIWGKFCVELTFKLLDLFRTSLLEDNNNEYARRWQGLNWETKILKQKYEFQRIILMHSLTIQQQLQIRL